MDTSNYKTVKNELDRQWHLLFRTNGELILFRFDKFRTNGEMILFRFDKFRTNGELILFRFEEQSVDRRKTDDPYLKLRIESRNYCFPIKKHDSEIEVSRQIVWSTSALSVRSYCQTLGPNEMHAKLF